MGSQASIETDLRLARWRHFRRAAPGVSSHFSGFRTATRTSLSVFLSFYQLVIDTAIRLAEDYAGGGAADPGDAAETAAVADQCALDSDGLDHLAGAIAHVSCCASKVAFRALSADLPYAPDTSEIAAEVASIAAEAYVSAGRTAAGAGGGEWLATTMLAANRDIQTLHALRLGNPGKHGQVIDPSEDGPLGPVWP